MTATRARALCDMLRVQVKTSDATPAGNPTLIAAGLAYLNPLGPHTGIDTLRDDTTGNLSVLEGFGTKLDIYAAYSSPGSNQAAFLGTMKSLVATGKVVLLEGPLEVDNQGWGMAVTNGCSYVGAGWQLRTPAGPRRSRCRRTSGRRSTARCRLRPSAWRSRTTVRPAAPQPGRCRYCSVSNTHFYSNGGKCASDELSGYGLRGVIAYETGYRPNLPKAITETGFDSNPLDLGSEGYDGCEVVNAKDLLNEICLCYQMGLFLVSIYQMMDDATGTSVSWGLFGETGTPHELATALRNFLTIIGDAAPNADTFTLIPYTVSVTNLPANGYSVQLQRSNGDNIVIVGIDATIYQNGTLISAPSYQIAVSLPTAANLNVYDPLVGTTPISAVTAASGTSIGTHAFGSPTGHGHASWDTCACACSTSRPEAPIEGRHDRQRYRSIADRLPRQRLYAGPPGTSGGPRIAVNGVADFGLAAETTRLLQRTSVAGEHQQSVVVQDQTNRYVDASGGAGDRGRSGVDDDNARRQVIA